MGKKIYNLDDPVIVNLSHYTLTKKGKSQEALSKPLHNQPFYINSTFSEFKKAYNTISVDDAYSILGYPINTGNKNLTNEESCLETLLSLETVSS